MAHVDLAMNPSNFLEKHHPPQKKKRGRLCGRLTSSLHFYQLWNSLTSRPTCDALCICTLILVPILQDWRNVFLVLNIAFQALRQVLIKRASAPHIRWQQLQLSPDYKLNRREWEAALSPVMKKFSRFSISFKIHFCLNPVTNCVFYGWQALEIQDFQHHYYISFGAGVSKAFEHEYPKRKFWS